MGNVSQLAPATAGLVISQPMTCNKRICFLSRVVQLGMGKQWVPGGLGLPWCLWWCQPQGFYIVPVKSVQRRKPTNRGGLRSC